MGGSISRPDMNVGNKMQQLKDRFRRINANYNQNQKLIHQNIAECLQGYQNPTKPHNNQPINQFSISQADLTFSQTHQTSNQSLFQPNSLTHQATIKNINQLQFINKICQVVGSQKGSRFSSLTGNELLGNSSRLESLNQTLSQVKGQDTDKVQVSSKYASLTKELQAMKHKELMQLLIEEIQDNQKNKHSINEEKLIREQDQLKWQQQTQKLQASIRVRDEELAKLKLQLQNKREQIEVLLISQKKNLQSIDKLKKTISALSSSNNTTITLSNPPNPKAQTPASDPSTKSKHPSMSNNNTKTNNTTTQLQQQLCTLRLQHTQLQSYMNQYIAQVTQTQEQYTRNYSQLRQSHTRTKQQNLTLTTQLQRLHQTLNSLQSQVNQLKRQNQQLSHALSNSKTFIKQLQQQFINAKDQNLTLSQQAEQQIISMRKIITKQQLQVNQLKLQLHQLRQELSIMTQEKYTMEQELSRMGEELYHITGEIGQLRQDNQGLTHENKELARDLEQLQEKILGNTEVQSQVRAMVQLMARQKDSIQQKVNDKLQMIDKLRQQLKQKQYSIKSYQNQQSTYNTNLTHLQHQLSLLSQQNQILQQTNTQLTQLQSDLMVQYEQQKQQTSHLRSELIGIMGQVKKMEEVYGWELGVNEKIKRELQRFWQGKLGNVGLGMLGKRKQAGGCDQKQLVTSITSQQQSCEISFSNKTSQITKQGSSSLFKPHVSSRVNDDANPNSSKVSQKQKICTDSIIQGSAIQEKYYSESQTQNNQLELNVLRPSTKGNVNIVEQTRKDGINKGKISRGLNQSR